MSDSKKTSADVNSPQEDTLKNKDTETKTEQKKQNTLKGFPPDIEPKYKNDKTFRWVAFRVFKHNIVKKDYEELGLKTGDDYIVTFDDFIEILEKLASTRDGLEFYAITHSPGEDNEHYHGVVHCGDNSQITFAQLKKLFPFSFIYGIQYGSRNAIQYLVHMNAPEKEQYSWDSVITNAPPAKFEDFKIPFSELPHVKIKRIVKDIIEGRIKEYEVSTKITPDIYIKYKGRIKNAFEYLNEGSLVDNNRDFQVYVLQGPPRIGKSTFCKCWAKKHNMSIGFSSSGKHPFDEYRGQDCFVLDDYNYSVTSVDDMKKILDPHNNTGVAARYHNVLFKNCKVLFICTNTPICDWYVTESKEDREAFIKRISYVLDFESLSDDFVASYTVNEIIYQGKDDLIETETYPRKEYHEYKKYILKSVDDVMHTFDLKKYINPASDEEKKKQFLAEIDTL